MEACFTHLVNNSLVSKKELYKLAPRLFLIQNAVDQIVERLSAGLKCSYYSLAVVNIFTMRICTKRELTYIRNSLLMG